jgi:hypothetical protein
MTINKRFRSNFIENLLGFSIQAGLASRLEGNHEPHNDGNQKGESASDGYESHSRFVDKDSA